MYIDYSVINKVIDRHGEPVNIIVYSGKTYSDYGDNYAQSSTIYSVNAIFNSLGLKQNYVSEGQFGEMRESFFFKGTQTGVTVDNVIVRANGERWKVNKVSNHASEGTVIVQEAIVTNSG